MRPIRKPPAPAPYAAHPADRAIAVIGRFCSLCERRIDGEPSLWDSVRDRLVRTVDDAAWATLLVLCAQCAAWQQRTAGAPGGLLLPDRATTFRVRGPSPYVYSLERVTVKVVDDDGESVETAESDAAIVTGTTAEAAQTIARFRLNTPYYDAATRTMTIPLADHRSFADPRVLLRTEAWLRAEEIAGDELRRPGARGRAARDVRDQVELTGFWSSWLTVLWRTTPDRALLEPIFLPDPVPRRHGRPIPALPPTFVTTSILGTSPSFLD